MAAASVFRRLNPKEVFSILPAMKKEIHPAFAVSASSVERTFRSTDQPFKNGSPPNWRNAGSRALAFHVNASCLHGILRGLNGHGRKPGLFTRRDFSSLAARFGCPASPSGPAPSAALPPDPAVPIRPSPAGPESGWLSMKRSRQSHAPYGNPTRLSRLCGSPHWAITRTVVL